MRETEVPFGRDLAGVAPLAAASLPDDGSILRRRRQQSGREFEHAALLPRSMPSAASFSSKSCGLGHPRAHPAGANGCTGRPSNRHPGACRTPSGGCSDDYYRNRHPSGLE
ncbi:hypothetical protein SAMCFNEI73_pC0098 (plasmid) [Sinorhizobium americanum]|uniref:Uncharacterized protein n=1 Tax=Sinorhizobium americanum TaxID=194963 RepID=A0A1L3LUS5_9HYPH|nr:hypothetical protein SAMCFNEI73_pC0098 [Sinorhizobium americanum]